jgi:hypothetical protein
MEALKLVAKQKNHSKYANKKAEINQYAQISEAELMKLFPLPRYFQIHFQHLHDNIGGLKTDTQELKQTLQQLDTKIDFLLQLLTQTSR